MVIAVGVVWRFVNEFVFNLFKFIKLLFVFKFELILAFKLFIFEYVENGCFWFDVFIRFGFKL